MYAQSHLCSPIDCSPPSSSVRGISPARILEQVAISFSRGSSPPRDQTRVSCVSCSGRRALDTSASWEALKVTRVDPDATCLVSV